MFYDSKTQLILTKTMWLKKFLEKFTDQIKKQKKYRSIGNELSIKSNTERPEI